MKRSTVVAALLVLALGLAAANVRAQSPGTRADEDAIRKVITTMTEEFNRHDAAGATRMYADGARLVTVRGEVMDGRAAMEKGLAAIFATRARNAMHRTLDVSIRFIRPDVALAHVTNELSGLVAPDGQALPAHKELSLRIFAKDGGTWRVEAFHNTMVRPFDAPAR